jgi:hypothetical protein
MAIDYAQMTNGRQENLAAARAPVVSFEHVKSKRLTKKSKGALLRGRNVEKKMAKKKRTAKQEAATIKLIAYNRRKARGGTTKRKTVRSRGRRASAAAVVMAREPSTAIVKYEHPTRVAVTKKKTVKKKSGKSGSRSKTRRTAKQQAATKNLVAYNRSRSSGKTAKKSARKSPRRSTRRRARAVITVSASERKGRRRSRRRRTGAMENPMTGVELFIGTITGLLGFGTADVVDRILSTHALTGVTSGTMTAFTDVPPTSNPAQGTRATYGSLFNSTAVCAPMNLERWGVGLLISGVPILIGHFVSAPVGRSSLQFFGFGALMRVAGKGLIDLVATLSKSNQTGMRLYSGEQRAAAVLANDGTVANLPANAPTGLGNPRMLGAPPPTLAMHKTGCGCGKCAGAGYPSMPAPQMAPAPPVVTQPPPAPPVQQITPPVVDNTFIRGVPRGNGFVPSPGIYNWGENTKAA